MRVKEREKEREKEIMRIHVLIHKLSLVNTFPVNIIIQLQNCIIILLMHALYKYSILYYSPTHMFASILYTLQDPTLSIDSLFTM